MPSHFAEAPVATMTASAVYSTSSLQSRNGRPERSTRVTSPGMNRVPNLSACPFIRSISSGPITPSAKPG